MDKEEIRKILKGILISVLKHDEFEVNDELESSDVSGWDSLTHMIIITETEASFDIKFKLRELNKLKNIGSLISLIQEKI